MEGDSQTNDTGVERLMDEFLKSKGFYRKKIAKDGSCLFRAVAEQVLRCQNRHTEVRATCVDYLKKNRLKYESFIEGNFEEYLKRLEDPQNWVGEVEISALAVIYRHDFIIFQEPGKPPVNITENSFSDKVRLCFLNGNHYDSVYPQEFVNKAALCQSILYELLYERVYGVDRNVVSACLHRSRDAEDDGYTECKSSDESDLEEEGDFWPGDAAALSDTKSPKPSSGVQPSKPGKAQQQRLTLSPRVQMSLNPCLFRNVEYDVWLRSQRAQQKRDFCIAAGMQYAVGDKCKVRLDNTGKIYSAYIQEVGPNNGPITVFVEELGKKHSIPLWYLRPVSAVDADSWSTVAERGKRLCMVNGNGHHAGRAPHRGRTGSAPAQPPLPERDGRGGRKPGKSPQGPPGRMHKQYSWPPHATAEEPAADGSAQTTTRSVDWRNGSLQIRTSSDLTPKSQKPTSTKTPFRKGELGPPSVPAQEPIFGLSPHERLAREEEEKSRALLEIMERDETSFPALASQVGPRATQPGDTGRRGPPQAAERRGYRRKGDPPERCQSSEDNSLPCAPKEENKLTASAQSGSSSGENSAQPHPSEPSVPAAAPSAPPPALSAPPPALSAPPPARSAPTPLVSGPPSVPSVPPDTPPAPASASTTTPAAPATPAASLPAPSAPAAGLPAPSAPVAALPAPANPAAGLPAPSAPAAGLPAPSAPAAGLPAPSAPAAGLPAPSAPAAGLPAPSAPAAGLPAPSAPAAGLPAPSAPAAGLPAPSAPAAGLPAPSAPAAGLPAPSAPVAGLPAPSAPAAGLPAPSAPAAGLPAPSAPAAGLPAPSAPAAGLPAPSGPAAGLPAPSGPAAGLPAPSGPAAGLPAPSGPAAGLPAPSGPAAGLPAPSGPAAGLPAPSGPAAGLPAPSGPAAGLPAPSGPAAGLPAPSGPAAGLPAPSGPVAGLPAPANPAAGLPAPSAPAASISAHAAGLLAPTADITAPSPPVAGIPAPSAPAAALPAHAPTPSPTLAAPFAAPPPQLRDPAPPIAFPPTSHPVDPSSYNGVSPCPPGVMSQLGIAQRPAATPPLLPEHLSHPHGHGHAPSPSPSLLSLHQLYQDLLYPGFPAGEKDEILGVPPFSYMPNGQDLPREIAVLRFFFNLGVKAYTNPSWPPHTYLYPLQQAHGAASAMQPGVSFLGPWYSEAPPPGRFRVNAMPVSEGYSHAPGYGHTPAGMQVPAQFEHAHCAAQPGGGGLGPPHAERGLCSDGRPALGYSPQPPAPLLPHLGGVPWPRPNTFPGPFSTPPPAGPGPQYPPPVAQYPPISLGYPVPRLSTGMAAAPQVSAGMGPPPAEGPPAPERARSAEKQAVMQSAGPPPPQLAPPPPQLAPPPDMPAVPERSTPELPGASAAAPPHRSKACGRHGLRGDHEEGMSASGGGGAREGYATPYSSSEVWEEDGEPAEEALQSGRSYYGRTYKGRRGHEDGRGYPRWRGEGRGHRGRRGSDDRRDHAYRDRRSSENSPVYPGSAPKGQGSRGRGRGGYNAYSGSRETGYSGVHQRNNGYAGS